MLLLLGIYGLTFGCVGLLSLELFPEFKARLFRYATGRAKQTSEQLSDMFLDLSERRLMLAYGISPFVTGLLGFWFGGMPGVIAGAIVGVLLPKHLLRLLQWRRQRKFVSQLGDALLALSSSLKAGLSFLQGLEVLAEEFPTPLSQEVGLVVKEVRMGLSLDEALRRLKDRMQADETTLLVTSMLVARETGGDVTQVFAKLVDTIRERQKIRERIKTLTTMPRIQGWLMAALPFFFTLFAMKLNAEYFQILLHDPTGQLVGLTAVGLWLISLVLITWFSRPAS